MDKKIELYTWTSCPFCKNAKKLLDNKGYEYKEYVIDNDEEKRQELINDTDQDTVPYVFIDGKLIGGYTDLKQLDSEGKL